MNHKLEIVVNNILIDLFEEGVNLRMNNILYDPTKLIINSASYSFTFNLPVTATNSKVFNYANVSSKKSKFSGRYPAIVYADGEEIFNGTLKITEVTKQEFKCNLVVTKNQTLETLFGETTMSEIEWKVPFKGVSTINQVNADDTTKYFFPLVAYSLFNKVPDIQTQSGNRRYTDKYLIDDTNVFYFNSFVPSLNMVETMKRCARSKGYELLGDIISDKYLNDIYLSNYIADEQDPLYNYGDPDMGTVELSINWKNYSGTSLDSANMIEYPLGFIPQTFAEPLSGYNNYDTAFVWNALSSAYATKTITKNDSKMYVNGGIQIPADGWYEITMDMNIGTPTTQGDMIAELCTEYLPAYENEDGSVSWDEARTYSSVTLNSSISSVDGKYGDLMDNFPVEVQLCRYSTDDGEVSNINHNIIYFGSYPNESDYQATITDVSTGSIRVGVYTNNSGGINALPSIIGKPIATAIDPYNNPDFVCGMSHSAYGRSYGYIKDGYSWHSDTDINNESLYKMLGYDFVYTDFSLESGNMGWTTGSTASDVNANELRGSTNNYYPSAMARRTEGQIQMIVRLNKNDMLIPFVQTRGYYLDAAASRADTSVSMTPQIYQADATINIKLRAVAPQLVGTSKLLYNMNSLFDTDLNLGNFNNNQQKMSDFFNDVIKAFNLDCVIAGKTIQMNKNKMQLTSTAPINIDNKVNTDYATFQEIEFPKDITVQWNIDTEEEGFYRSVEANTTEEQMQSNNWKDYGDYGYEKVPISMADDANSLEQKLNFSYNWFQPFKIKTLSQDNEVSIPVIGKTEWWIEGYKYEEMAKNDGRGFRQRFWFRNTPTNIQLPVQGDYYIITTPIDYREYSNDDIMYLTYNNGENTILGKYFNIDIDSTSDALEIEVYLTPIEYKLIKNGASVLFDDNLYKCSKIDGYDPNGYNMTKLTLISF